MYVYTPQELRDDGSDYFYHYTGSIDEIRESKKIHATADASVYFVSHIENRGLGGAPPNGVIAIKRTCLSSIKPLRKTTPWNRWKSLRGELTSPAGHDIEILKYSHQYLKVGKDIFSALVVTDAQTIQQKGWRRTYGVIRRASRLYIEVYLQILSGIIILLGILWIPILLRIPLPIPKIISETFKSVFWWTRGIAIMLVAAGAVYPVGKYLKRKVCNFRKELRRNI